MAKKKKGKVEVVEEGGVSAAMTAVAPSKFPPGVSPRNGVAPPAHMRFKPGQIANPTGKPKGFYPISAAMADIASWDLRIVQALAQDGLGAECPEGVNEHQFASYKKKLKPAHYTALAHWAASVDVSSSNMTSATRTMLDRTEGAVRQEMSLTTFDATEIAGKAFDEAVEAAQKSLAEEAQMRALPPGPKP